MPFLSSTSRNLKFKEVFHVTRNHAQKDYPKQIQERHVGDEIILVGVLLAKGAILKLFVGPFSRLV